MNPITCLLEVKEAGSVFKGFALIKESKDGVATNRSPFFDITLGKQHKTVLGKLWENKFGGHSVPALKEMLKAGNIILVEGRITEYRGNLQIGIENFHPIQKGEVDISEFIATAPEPEDSMVAEFEAFIEDIKTPILHEIVKSIYQDHKSAFIIHPAGKSMHHAFKSGLLYHSLSMLRICRSIADQYPQIDRDLLYSGCSLHDLAKTIELHYENSVIEYTNIGKFLGHIQLINMLIDRKLQSFAQDKGKYTRKDYDKAIQLMSIVTSHHGKLEWGTPVAPCLLEGEILHHIDMLDSRINMITDGLADKAEGDFHKVYPLGNFYKPYSE